VACIDSYGSFTLDIGGNDRLFFGVELVML
jgi:hypothetical protein